MELEEIKKQLKPFNPDYWEETDDDDNKNAWISIDFPTCELSLTYDTSEKSKKEIAFSYAGGNESFYGVYKGKDIGHFVQMIIDYYTGLGR
jgi:hypothetical protein